MTADLFDRDARRLARQRALRVADPFLLQAAFGDLLDRLAAIERPQRDILLVGAIDPTWSARLAAGGATVTVAEPAESEDEDRTGFPRTHFDAVVACGTLDTVNDLPRALGALAASLRPDSPLLGVLIGGNSFPRLRRSLLTADGPAASPRAHPRIEPSSLGTLLANAGLAMPVIDVERSAINYASLDRLV
ncbi:MAG: methyltransferase domain-containing protein, partial [Sphingomicrobium sp.]